MADNPNIVDTMLGIYIAMGHNASNNLQTRHDDDSPGNTLTRPFDLCLVSAKSITRQVAALAVMDKHGEEREYFQMGKGLGLTPPIGQLMRSPPIELLS